MKKTVLLFLTTILLSFPVITMAQASTDNTKLTETERVIDKYSEKIYNGFSVLIEKAEEPVKTGFHYVVKKQIAQGVVGLLPLTIFLLLLYPLFYSIQHYEGDEFNGYTALAILFGFTEVILLVTSICATGNAVMHLIAPEYYAIEDIARLVGIQ